MEFVFLLSTQEGGFDIFIRNNNNVRVYDVKEISCFSECIGAVIHNNT